MFLRPRFPPVFSQSTTTPTPLNGIRLNPCPTPLWCVPSCHLVGPTPNTSYEFQFCIDVSGEHTPINLPTRNMVFQQEYDATLASSEDLNLLRHSGASSRSQNTAASTVPTLLKLGSLGPSFTKVSADYYSCKQYTCSAHVFLMHSRCAVILSLTSRTDLTHHAWLENHGAHCAQALLPHVYFFHLSASTNPAEIYCHV